MDRQDDVTRILNSRTNTLGRLAECDKNVGTKKIPAVLPEFFKSCDSDI